MQEIKITRAATLKEKPDSSTLVFGKAALPSVCLRKAGLYRMREQICVQGH